MNFKFFSNDNPIPIDYEDFERERRIERLRNIANERRNQTQEDIEYHRAMLEIEDMVEPTPLSVDNRPAVFTRLNRNRDTISEQEWNSIVQREQIKLTEHMYHQGMIMHTIISEDQNGFTLRTEILF